MKQILQHFRENWYRYGLETLVVVFGVLIAFSLNNWNENRKRTRLANTYIQSLHSDFLQNDELINHAVQQLEGTKNATLSLSVFIESGFKQGDVSAVQIDYNKENWDRNVYLPIVDTASLIYNLNRSGFVTNYDLILPTWDEIINSGHIDLIENDALKEEIVRLHFLAAEAEELETKIITPIVRDYKAIRAKYYNTSRSRPIPEESPEYGLFKNDPIVDIDGFRSNEEVRYHLQRVFRAANEQQSLITGMVGEPSDAVIELLEDIVRK